jgi:hypothetical protein
MTRRYRGPTIRNGKVVKPQTPSYGGPDIQSLGGPPPSSQDAGAADPPAIPHQPILVSDERQPEFDAWLRRTVSGSSS